MQPVKSVAIVGAGSSGWLTALALNTYCPFLKIRIIRPRDHAAIGVGESTQGDFVTLLQEAGIDLQDFYKACDGTMKCGIFYRDWNVIGDHYWHPFTRLTGTRKYTPAHHYQQLIMRDPERYRHDQYYAAVHTSYDACVRKKLVAPEAAIAFHVDAKLITDFFERELTRVEVLEADSIDVKTKDGKVAALVLDGKETAADLYVDCTGFKRAVHGKVAESKLMPYEANVNRAVAASVPYLDVEKEIRPYTRAHAHKHGWTWTIPLRSRIGSGYVYHGDFCSPEEAEREFRAYWGEERMRDVAVAHIPFDSATLLNPWAENVVAIGLSAGFVEPLEATGLNWVNTSAVLLCHSIIGHFYADDTRDRYNSIMAGYVYDVQDFIDVHYKLSSRRDSEFWKYQTSRKYPDRLEYALELYAAEMPTKSNRIRSFMKAFSDLSWIDILNGYQFKYAKLDVQSRQAAVAQAELEQIAASPKRGIAPLAFVPGSENSAAPSMSFVQ
jgi:tryptophan halogenase